jgi:hypothetical protein
MKNIGLIFLISIFWGCQNKQQTYHADKEIKDYNSLVTLFENPPSYYSTVPFWVWNDEVTREKIERQLDYFKEQQINSVIIHSRPGLITEYLSDEWFDLNEYALAEAKKRNMKLWLYDENCFPSGYAGGHVQRQMPESYVNGTGLRMQVKQNVDTAEVSIAFLALLQEDGKFTNISDSLAEYVGQPGTYFLFEKTYAQVKEREGGYPYPDLLVPGVTEKFIETTMPGYEKTFGEDFGRNVMGVFTDEPHIKPPSKGDIRWTPTLFNDYEKRWGYRLETHLPSLWEDIGNYQKIRHDYYQLLIELFVERWSKPWYEYTEANNLSWTGHYWEHGWPNPRHAGDNMILYAYHQVPGIDMLFNDIDGRPDQFGNIFAGRELLSIANQFGRKRTLSETYGASGWDLDFEAMKRLGDWEYAAGVNLMNQHLAYMTTKGSRKRDFPQSISWHASWWKHYHNLAQHYSRLSVAMSSGENINDILVLEPTTTTWMYFTPAQDNNFLGASGITNEYGENFKSFVRLLESLKIEFDLGSEMVIQEFASCDSGQFVIQKRAYDKVILGPHVENLNRKTFELLKQYTKAGGMVYYQDIPYLLDAELSDETEQLVAKYPEQWIAISDNEQQLTELFANQEFQLLQSKDPENLFHQRRKLEDGQLVFWTNFSKNQINDFTFTISGKAVSWFNTFTGEIYQLPARKTGQSLEIAVKLHPGESKLMYIHDIEVKGRPLPAQPEEYRLIETKAPDIQRVEDNLLVLDYCDVQSMGKSVLDINYLHATDSIFKWHGLPKSDIDHNPWNFTTQYKTELLDLNDDFGERTGFEATFTFIVDQDYQLKPMKIGIEYGRLYQVRINGKNISPDKDLHYFDHSVDVYPVDTEDLKIGENQVSLTIQPMHIHAELERIFVLGDFDLQPSDQGFFIKESDELNLGNWVTQGLPFYPEAVNYSKPVDLESGRTYLVKLNDWQGAVAQVKVNEKNAGIIGWQPYELDISDFVNAGENTIEILVYGTPRNQLGPHYYEVPVGIATPWSWNQAPRHQPAGENYSFVSYGLMEDFEVMVGEERQVMATKE